MKKISLYLAWITAAVSFVGCDALDLAPVDNYAYGNYWKTKDQCDRFLTGLHVRMRAKAETFFTMGEYRGGLFEENTYTHTGSLARNMPIITNNLSISNPGLSGWGGFYADIMQINHAIEKISEGLDCLSDTETNFYLGQLYGMRAYYYFHLHRTWGGVPLVSEPEVLYATSIDELNRPRATEAETLRFIRDDVQRSVAAFEEDGFSSPDGAKSWTKAATYCLAAEVLLWSAKVKPAGGGSVFSQDVPADLTAAKGYLTALEGKYALQSDFGSVFSVKDNREMILAMRFRYGESTNWFADFLYNATTFTSYYDQSGVKLTDPFTSKSSGGLWNDYLPDLFLTTLVTDQRRAATFFYYTDAAKSFDGVLMIKFLGNIYNNIRSWDDDFPIYRYADVLLMLAEVNNELDLPAQAEGYLNDVRERATGNRTFSYTTKEDAEQAILDERKLEFIGEAKRWYDIRRMKNAQEALALTDDNSRKLLWPVDQSTLSKDPLVKQTPGYDE